MTDYRGIQEKFHQVAEALKGVVAVIQELEHDFESAGSESPASPFAGAQAPGEQTGPSMPPGSPPASMAPPWMAHPSYAAMMQNLMQMMAQLPPEAAGAPGPAPPMPGPGDPPPPGYQAVPVPVPMWGFGMPGWGWPPAAWAPFWMAWGGSSPGPEATPPPGPTFPGSWTWSWEPRGGPSGPRHVHASEDQEMPEGQRNG